MLLTGDYGCFLLGRSRKPHHPVEEVSLMTLLYRATTALMALVFISCAALAQKQGGTLRVYHRDSPASMSIYEETTLSTSMPMMGVFNNLVVYNPSQTQNRLDNIIADLAESWSVSEDAKDLTFKLRSGVKWHDGKPFTANDVKCSWDLLLGAAKEKLRINAREAWWTNLKEVTADADSEATFHLKRPQPSFLALLASGFSPVYPCHISPSEMRQHPVGTGPFKFVEFKPNQSIKVIRNTDYWKPGRPYLDAIEYTIIPNRSTAMLAFAAGQFDLTFPYEITIAMLKDLRGQMPQAVCEITPMNVSMNLSITRKPPFDKTEVRRAIAMSLDRKAFIDILGDGQGDIGTALLPAPEGQWATPKEIMEKLPGYDPDVNKSRAEAQSIMRSVGYGPDNRIDVKIVTRNLPDFRDPASIAADQLKNIWMDGEVETVETANFLPKLMRSDFAIALTAIGSGLDDPDQNFYENYICDSKRNYTRYCSREVDNLIDRQSMERDLNTRRALVWEIDRRLQENIVRPILYYMRKATCWSPDVRGLKLQVNSIYNGWRMEDVWLNR
jgi:peptide/nickel transport system substrate-binding protein